MKNIKRFASVILIILTCLFTFTLKVKEAQIVDASSATVYTYALNKKGRLTRTQDAYLPSKTFASLGIVSPRDIFSDKNDNIYIAGKAAVDSATLDDVWYLLELVEENQELGTSKYYGYTYDNGVKKEVTISKTPTDEDEYKASISYKENGEEKYTLDLNGSMYVKASKSYKFNFNSVDHLLKLENSQQSGIFKFDQAKGTISKKIVIKNTSIRNASVNQSQEKYSFNNVQGVFVDEKGLIYVADSSAKQIFILSATGEELINVIQKPTDASFTKVDFQPKKVAVDKAGTLYVILEGANDGILKLTKEGEYLGFFANNKVSLTVKQQLENLIYSEEQLAQLSPRNPLPFSNIFVDHNGIVYSTTMSSSSVTYSVENLKKHNTAGNNMITDVINIHTNLSDVFVDRNGRIYVTDSTGWIDIYSQYGELIFTFGTSTSTSVAGIFKSLQGIAVTTDGTIWAIDGEKNYLQSYTPTEYTKKVYTALNKYEIADYEGAIEIWEDVLKLNQLSVLAHNGIGKNYLNIQEYEKAAEHFKLAGNRTLYSEAYWETRNIWLQSNLVAIILCSVGLWILSIVIKKTNRKHHYLDKPRNFLTKITSYRKIDDVLYAFHVMKHPVDSMYYLKKKERGSYLGATILLLLGFVAYMTYSAGKGFIFQVVDAKDMELSAIVIGFFAIVVLFAIANYLVTSIKDGEGGFGPIYKGICYALMPMILAAFTVTAFSYVATLDESFILTLIWNVGLIYTLLIVFISITEMQNYTISQAITSIIISLLFIGLFAILAAFVQMIGEQLVVFIVDVIKEGIRNVFS